MSKLEKEMKLEAEKTILCAAKLIAPVIEDTLTAGFAWYALKNYKELYFNNKFLDKNLQQICTKIYF